MLASLVGFYTMPFFNKILPKYKSTPMDKIILNCAIFIVFSSALPVSTKILGLTRFDLLGHFGDLHWLSNVYIIFFYNFGFAIATGLCLFAKFTATVRSELYNRVLILFQNALFSETSPASLFINSPRHFANPHHHSTASAAGSLTSATGPMPNLSNHTLTVS